MANGLCSSPLISTPFWANRYLPLSVASEHFALLEAFSSLAYPAPTVVRTAAPTTTTRISARPLPIALYGSLWSSCSSCVVAHRESFPLLLLFCGAHSQEAY